MNKVKKNLPLLVFFVVIVFLAYSNGLFGAFISDDIAAIRDNPNIGSISWALSQKATFLRTFFYTTIYTFFGLRPFGYHLFNIILHTFNVCLVFLILRNMDFKKEAAFFAATLFAVHPLLTESVTWISGGPYPQYSFFLLLSFWFFIASESIQGIIFSIVLYTLSLLSSYMALVYPLILVWYCFSFKKPRTYYQKILPFFLPLATFGLYFLFRVGQRITEVTSGGFQNEKVNPIVQIPVAITTYLYLLIFPNKLTFYHADLTLSQAEYIVRLLLFIFLIGLVFFAYKKNKKIFFWSGFFFITLLPTLTPLRISWIVAERYVYLGSIGFFAIIGLFFEKLVTNQKTKLIALVIFAIIAGILMMRTVIRNMDWKNEDTLWIATVKTSPTSPTAHNNMGDVYGRRKQYREALEEFKKAIQLDPGYADAYHNLGVTYHIVGNKSLAEKAFKNAIKFNPNLWQSYQNLAAIYYEQKKYKEAIVLMERAVQINPYDSKLFSNLGVLYVAQKRFNEAVSTFEKALSLDPANQRARQALEKMQKSQ